MKCSGQEDVELAVQNAKTAQLEWGKLSGFERSKCLSKCARLLQVFCCVLQMSCFYL